MHMVLSILARIDYRLSIDNGSIINYKIFLLRFMPNANDDVVFLLGELRRFIDISC